MRWIFIGLGGEPAGAAGLHAGGKPPQLHRPVGDVDRHGPNDQLLDENGHMSSPLIPRIPSGRETLIFWPVRTELLLSVLLSTPAGTTRKRPARAVFVSENLEATVGIEPTIGVLQTPALTTWPRRLGRLLVPRRGFEPLRPFGHRPLKTACLPIPPPRRPPLYYRFPASLQQTPPRPARSPGRRV